MIRVHAVLLAVALLTLTPAVAHAQLGFQPGDPVVQVLDGKGEPYAIAGGHPSRLLVSFGFNPREDNAKNVLLDFPPGFSGDPGAVPACPRRLFEESVFGGKECDSTSRVGTLTVYLGEMSQEVPIFSIQSAPGQLAEQGAALFGRLLFLTRIRPEDLGLTIAQEEMVGTLPLTRSKVELWGVPADDQEGAEIPRRPFLTMPTRCDGGPLTVTIRASSWQAPDRWISATGDTGVPLVGCDTLPYKPAVGFAVSSREVDSPTGVHLDLSMPQSDAPDGRASGATKQVDLTLPDGLSISPGAAEQAAACSDAELRIGSGEAVACPNRSRVGTVELAAPQIPAPLKGGAYLGQELPGRRFRLFLVAEGFGVSAKLIAILHPDPRTGGIAIALHNLPTFSFTRLGLELDGGDAALLATPLTCGPLIASAAFSRYDGLPAVPATGADAINQGVAGGPCPDAPAFAPQFTGGATAVRAGRPTGMTLTLGRQSGEPLMSRFRVLLPPGLAAAAGSVPLCADQAATAGTCPSGSQIGSAVAEFGSGPSPASIGGAAYLTGPYRRGPLGLALVFPGAIGPFDLGSIVVRAAIEVDPESGQLAVASDGLPSLFEGVPVRFRTIGIDIDHPGFLRNPTFCGALSLDAEVRAFGGAVATRSSPFRVRGCDSLRFSPRLSLRLTGSDRLRRGDHPGLRVGVRARVGQVNLRSVDIGLPAYLRHANLSPRRICARQDAIEGNCSRGAQVGSATASTSLLAGQLRGPVDIVQPAGAGLPELWTQLDAGGAHLVVRSEIFVRGRRLHTRFVQLPDLRLSRLSLQLRGGSRGLLSLSSDPCPGRGRSAARARADLEGQDRAYAIKRLAIGAPGCPGAPRAGREARRNG